MKRILCMLTSLILLVATGCTSGNPETESKKQNEESNTISSTDTLHSENFDFTINSIDVQKTIRNELGVEYAASENCVLVLVDFTATNTSDDTQNVMNTNFNSYIDDNKVVILSAAGKINGHLPLIGAVSAGKNFEGYAIWEAPADWATISFSYIDALSGAESESSFVINANELAG